MANATWTNTIGAPELVTVWTDPDFDPSQPAFYYGRVIEIPTPRWTAYDAKRFGTKPLPGTAMTITERAYTSPIWYTPGLRRLPYGKSGSNNSGACRLDPGHAPRLQSCSLRGAEDRGASMRCLSHPFVRPVLASLCLVGGAGAVLAADLATPAPAPIIEAPIAMPPVWGFRFTPYGWLTSMKGTQTVRGRSTKVDASFIDIVEKSDTLVALMGTFEARNGPFALYGDLVWSKVGVEGGNVRTRTPGARHHGHGRADARAGRPDGHRRGRRRL